MVWIPGWKRSRRVRLPLLPADGGFARARRLDGDRHGAAARGELLGVRQHVAERLDEPRAVALHPQGARLAAALERDPALLERRPKVLDRLGDDGAEIHGAAV